MKNQNYEILEKYGNEDTNLQTTTDAEDAKRKAYIDYLEGKASDWKQEYITWSLNH